MMPELKVGIVLHNKSDRRRDFFVYLGNDQLWAKLRKNGSQYPIVVAVDVQTQDAEIFSDVVRPKYRPDVFRHSPIATGVNFREILVGPREFYELPSVEFDAQSAPAFQKERVGVGPTHSVARSDINCGAIVISGE